MKIKCVICGKPTALILNNNLCSFVCSNCCNMKNCYDCKTKICINITKFLEIKEK